MGLEKRNMHQEETLADLPENFSGDSKRLCASAFNQTRQASGVDFSIWRDDFICVYAFGNKETIDPGLTSAGKIRRPAIADR